MSNEIEVVVAADGSQSLDKVEKHAKRTGESIEKSLGKGLDEAEKKSRKAQKSMGDDAAKIDKSWGDAARGIVADLDHVERQAAKTGRELQDALDGDGGGDGMLGGLLGDFSTLKGGALAAGAAVGAGLWQGFQAEWAEDSVGALIAGQVGAASGASERLGDIAGDVFSANFGDSIEQVGEAMSALFSSKLIDTSASDAAISGLTKKILTLQQTTGEGARELSRAVRTMLVTGVAENVVQAMDMIQQAQVQGLNIADDLLDTITEYSTQFRSLGLEGQESLGLMSQAMAGGARDTDTAADALKEFQIRAQDMSATTRRGFEALGMDADVMGQRIAAGGASARNALQETLNALQAMPDSVQRNSIAVDLFGTKAEDLGNALFEMDLDTAAAEMDEYGGAVQRAADSIGEGQSMASKLGKGLSTIGSGFAEGFEDFFGINEKLTGPLGEIQEKAAAVRTAIDTAISTGDTSSLEELKRLYPEVASSIDPFIEAMGGSADKTNEASSANDRYAGTLDQLISKQIEAVTGVIDFNDAQIAAQQAITGAKEAADEFANEGLTKTKDGFDLSTEAGQKMSSALYEVADTTWRTVEAMQQQGKQQQEVQGYVQGSRDKFFALARQMGLSEDAAHRLANQMFKIPLTRKSAVQVDTVRAQARLAIFRAAADVATRDRVMNVMVRANPLAGLFLGGFGRAHGGITGAENWAPRWGAQSGGQRHGSTLINEAGPEVVELPSGSRVMTAGATRAMAERGLLGGGGGPINVVVSWDGSESEVMRGILRGLRFTVNNDYGGNVQRALGRAGAA